MQYQNSNWIMKDADKLFRVNKNRSISAMFRAFRKKRNFALFGDYVILSEIIKTEHVLGIKTSRYQIWYAMQSSEELKDEELKTQLLNQLEAL